MKQMPGLEPLQRRNADGLIVPAHEPETAKRLRYRWGQNAKGENSFSAPPVLKSEPIEAFDPSTLEGRAIRPREWIVPDWLPVGSVTLCYADGGVGKTLLAQQLMTACAAGRSWCGINVMKCRSIGFFCEDDRDELHYRQSRINAAMGATFADLAETRWISGVGEDNLLITFDRGGNGVATDRFELIRSLALDFGAKLVVVDTAADTFGGNEIIRREVRQFVGQVLTRLAQDIGGAVLLNAHPSRAGLGKDGDQDGGSTAWNNSARSRWSITRQVDTVDALPDPDVRILTRRKANYASVGATIPLRWCAGALMTNATQPSDAPPEERKAAVQDVFMAILRHCDERGVAVSMSPSAGNYGPKMFAKRPDARGINRRAFEGAMHALLASDAIHVVTYGRPSQPCSKLAFKPAEADPTDGL